MQKQSITFDKVIETLNTMRTLSKSTKQKLVRQLANELYLYYRLSSGNRNTWRYNKALAYMTKKIDEASTADDLPKHKGAQWGGKWGNYYRMVAVNSEGRYEYVEGFNPEKKLK